MKKQHGPEWDFIRKAIQNGTHPAPPAQDLFDPTSVMALFLIEQKIKLLFIQKADVKGYPWANQMAFPGGHKDKADQTTRQTALRELEEELGIVSENVDVLGSIGHFQTLNNKSIEAWAGIWNLKDTIVPDGYEISRVFKIPLEYLIDVHTSNQYHVQEPAFMRLIYPYEDVLIWGVTAKILRHLINLILKN
ncbi:MAG: CoA pyrophosphatase [Pseudomonadota bacterium]